MENRNRATLLDGAKVFFSIALLTAISLGLGYYAARYLESRRQNVYYPDHVMACEKANKVFLEAREQYAKFLNGELIVHSDPAISALEELASRKSYDCDSITPEESCESIEERFPLIKVDADHGGKWVREYHSRH
ncbi:MAG: hypothetical protein ACFFDT_39645 [Candidatus Hodarchaeota archaeon]